MLKWLAKWLGKFAKRITKSLYLNSSKVQPFKSSKWQQYNSEVRQTKNVSIKCVTLNRGNDLELNTGFTINPKDWSKDTDRPKQNNTENKLILTTSKIRIIHLQQPQQRFRQHVLIDLFCSTPNKDCFESSSKTDQGLLITFSTFSITNTRKSKNKRRV
jgi:hypothetical protein